MHSMIISRYLSVLDETINIFDEIEKQIEYEFNKPVNSIQDMKDRDNKKRKGDIWEKFCKDWLLASEKYTRVWLLDEYNTEFPHAFLSKQDNGIDIIAKTSDGYHAIQCKYRKQTVRAVRVDWKSLSTFIALCERTGPCDGSIWEKYVVMTNCPGVTRKLPRSPKDKSICRKSFQNTKRDHWLRMIGKDTAQKLGSYSSRSICTTSPYNISPDGLQLVLQSSTKPLTLNVITPQVTMEEMRRRRLEYYK